MMDSEKGKVSKTGFAEGLYLWLSQRLSKEAVKETAEEFDFKIKSNKDFNKMFQELFALNMWLIVRTCERVFEDVDKRNECLDIFHRLVYERYSQDIGENFGKWMKLMGAKYIEYIKAMETEHPSGPLWVLAKLINTNLFGKLKKDPFIQLAISSYVAIPAEYLEELIKKYDIEWRGEAPLP
jgi:hypothetical protein